VEKKFLNHNRENRTIYAAPTKIDGEQRLKGKLLGKSYFHKILLMFKALFFHSPYAVVILDREQRIVNISKNFTKIFQYKLSEVKGKYIHQLVSLPEIKEQIDNDIQSIYKGEIVKREGVRRRKDGRLMYVEIIGYPVTNRQSIIGAYMIFNDISEKKAYEEQLELFKKILENNSEGVVITDTNGNIEWINTAFEKITGYSLPEVKGLNMNILKSGIQAPSFYANMWDELKNKGTWSGEVWNKTKHGQIYSEWLTISSIKDNFNKSTHYVGVFKDLTEKKKIDRRMAELQQKDILTGLYNRDYFFKLVDNQIKNSTSYETFCIAFVDIEGLKDINNSLGHHVGDRLLVEL